MLLFGEFFAANMGELEQNSIDDIFGRDLGLEPKVALDIAAASLLFVKHPAAATDHYMLPQLGKVCWNVSFDLNEVCCIVVCDVSWGYHHCVINVFVYLTSKGEETLAIPAYLGRLALVPLPLGAAGTKIKDATLHHPALMESRYACLHPHFHRLV